MIKWFDNWRLLEQLKLVKELENLINRYDFIATLNEFEAKQCTW